MNTLAEEWKREGYEEAEYEFLQKKDQWISEAKSEERIKNTQEMIIAAFQNRMGVVKPKLAEKIRKIQSSETLHSLFNQIFVVNDKSEFEKLVDEALEE